MEEMSDLLELAQIILKALLKSPIGRAVLKKRSSRYVLSIEKFKLKKTEPALSWHKNLAFALSFPEP